MLTVYLDSNMYDNIPEDLLDTLNTLFVNKTCTGFSTHVDLVSHQTKLVVRCAHINKEVNIQGPRHTKFDP